MATPANNSKTIARNSLWYALDSSAATIVMLIASVPVARVMGPKILGHYIYLLFLTGIVQRLANVGMAATTCKYMAEFLGKGQPGIAHGVFRTSLRYQASIASFVTAVGVMFAAFSSTEYRIVSILVVVSMWPAMVTYIPAQANVASEDLKANIPGTVVYLLSYLLIVILSLIYGWGLIGLATATLVSRMAEAGLRLWGVHRWLSPYPSKPLDNALRKRMFSFSRQTLVLLVLGLVVWDRSEVLFLRQFCDVKQVAFYSLAFSICNQLLMIPRGFSTAIGVTILAQYGRDPVRLTSLVRNATRYVSLLAIPVFLGTAAVAEPLIRVSYGEGYLAVVPALRIMCIMSIWRSFQMYSESMLQATEDQGFMVKWLVVTALINVTADAFAIPRYGANGAAVANGFAQSIGVAGLIYRIGCIRHMASQIRYLAGILISALIMVAVVLQVVKILPTAVGLPAGIATGAVVFLAAIRLGRVLESEDWQRLAVFVERFPKPVQRWARPLFPNSGTPAANSLTRVAASGQSTSG